MRQQDETPQIATRGRYRTRVASAIPVKQRGHLIETVPKCDDDISLQRTAFAPIVMHIGTIKSGPSAMDADCEAEILIAPFSFQETGYCLFLGAIFVLGTIIMFINLCDTERIIGCVSVG